MTQRPRVLVTRSPHQASELAEALRALGAEPILIPTIETVPPTTYASLDEAIADLPTYNWLLFTSANAVEAFHQRAVLSKTSNLKPETCSIAAIGPATARALGGLGLHADLIPPQAIAESLTEALLPHAHPGVRFLLVRAEEAREHLPQTLRTRGAEVTIAPAYRTVTPEGSLEALSELLTTNPPDAVTFTSSSTARNLFNLLASANLTLPEITIRVSIGPITTQTLMELGQPPQIEAAEATVQNLAGTLMRYLNVR